MNNQKLDLIEDALKHAFSLISDEYESLQDDQLKQEYDSTLKKLEIALEEIKHLTPGVKGLI